MMSKSLIAFCLGVKLHSLGKVRYFSTEWHIGFPQLLFCGTQWFIKIPDIIYSQPLHYLDNPFLNTLERFSIHRTRIRLLKFLEIRSIVELGMGFLSDRQSSNRRTLFNCRNISPNKTYCLRLSVRRLWNTELETASHTLTAFLVL